MSRDWTPEELQKAIQIMKVSGNMSYEEFCEYLDDQDAHASVERFGKVQTENITCPRCGKPNMRDPIHTNALSRFVDVYICNQCGMAEAIMSYTGTPPRLSNWAIIEAVNELFSEE